MQTFLPYPLFNKSALVLDRRRLGKQRVEVLQLLRTLHGENVGWLSHPCTKQWLGCEKALAKYGIAICEEWISRGYKDNCLDQITYYYVGHLWMPPWLNYEPYHASHRAILLAKDFEHYKQWKWEEEPAEKVEGRYPYIWPRGRY